MSIKVDVGTPPSNFEDWTTAEVRFHGFADLSTATISPVFSCFGHNWLVEIYPGGEEDSVDGYVAVRLCNMSNSSIKIQWCISVRDADGKEVVHLGPDTRELGACDPHHSHQNSRGYRNFATRSELLDALIEGTLIIEVRMKLVETSKYSSQFIPENPINDIILNQFNDEESADVIFEVDSASMTEQGGGECAGKRAKTTTTFYAHRLIVKDGAPLLAELCKPSAGGNVATVSITDVKPDIFRHMLYYAYGGKLTDEELEANAKDIIDACDKYGVVSLKLEAEVSYVNSTTLTNDNIIDNLLYADSKNLALLKESVMDYIVANKNDIIGKVSFSNVPSDMMTDLLTAMARGEQNDNNNNDSINYNKMRVGTLRKMLHEKGLDVDGSREAMIALLKENSEESDEVHSNEENE